MSDSENKPNDTIERQQRRAPQSRVDSGPTNELPSTTSPAPNADMPPRPPMSLLIPEPAPIADVPVVKTADGREATMVVAGLPLRVSLSNTGNVRLAADMDRNGKFTDEENLYNGQDITEVDAQLRAAGFPNLLSASLEANRTVSEGVKGAFSDGKVTQDEMADVLDGTLMAQDILAAEVKDVLDVLDASPALSPAIPKIPTQIT